MSDDAARHREKMQKIKAARARMMAGKTGEKGLIIVHTGPGKGKSSSGFGMLTRAIVNEEKLVDVEPAADLLEMEGMDEALAYELAVRGVVTMEDLAESSVDELIEIEGLDKTRAGNLIMTARIPWFAAEEAGA